MQNSEILTLTYGGIVRQLIADNENVSQVNEQLKKMYVCMTHIYVLLYIFNM